MRFFRLFHAVFVILTAVMLAVVDVSAQPRTQLYWVEVSEKQSSIMRATVGESNIETLASGLENLQGFDVNPNAGTLYWTLDENIVRMHIEEATPDTIMTEVGCGIPHHLGGIRLDLTARKLYVMRYSSCGNPFLRANLDGSDPETVPIESDGMSTTSFVIDSTGGKFYWWFRINSDDIGILSANLDGTEWGVIVPEVPAAALALDPETGRIYWTERSSGKIRRADPDGSEVEDVLVGLNNPGSIALDTANERIFWTEDDAGTAVIRQAKLDGSDVEDVFTGLTSAGGLRVGYVIGTSTEPRPASGPTTILKQNYPNPFKTSTTIEYELKKPGTVRLELFDLLGRSLYVLVDGEQGPGAHHVQLDVRDLSSGVYVYRLKATDRVLSQTLIVAK